MISLFAYAVVKGLGYRQTCIQLSEETWSLRDELNNIIRPRYSAIGVHPPPVPYDSPFWEAGTPAFGAILREGFLSRRDERLTELQKLITQSRLSPEQEAQINSALAEIEASNDAGQWHLSEALGGKTIRPQTLRPGLNADFGDFYEPILHDVTDFSNFLAEQGIHLVLVTLPTKAELFRGQLSYGAEVIPNGCNTALLRFQERLIQEGVDAFHLTPHCLKVMALRNQEMLEALDHHWTQPCMLVATKVLADHFQDVCPSLLDSHVAPDISLAVTEVYEPRHVIHVSGKQLESGRKPIVQVMLNGERIREAEDSPILILGDSNVQHYGLYKYGASGDITSLLASKLGAPLRSLARPSLGRDAPREYLYRSRNGKEPEIVVWFLNLSGTNNEGWGLLDCNSFERALSDGIALPPFFDAEMVVDVIPSTKIPDPSSSEYATAVASYGCIITECDEHPEIVGKKIEFAEWLFVDRVPTNPPRTKGDTLSRYIQCVYEGMEMMVASRWGTDDSYERELYAPERELRRAR